MNRAQRSVVLTLLLVLSVGGCATSNEPEAWTKEADAEGTFESDRYDCMKEARDIASRESEGLGGLSHSLTYETTYRRYFTACMEARGWRRR